MNGPGPGGTERLRNWFETPWVAPRYVSGRPDVHADIVRRIGARVAVSGPVERALDLACGTGLGARALRAVARRVAGADASGSMLREAQRAGGVPYVRARAEALPVADASLDLLTLGCAWHWCAPGALLDQAARTLRPGAWLVVYDSEFRGDARDPRLLGWLRSEYWSSLERVERRPYFQPALLRHAALVPVASEELQHDLPMTRDQVRTLVTSQASTVANVERGVFTLAEAEARLDAGLARLLPPAEARLMRFVAPIHFVRRAP